MSIVLFRSHESSRASSRLGSGADKISSPRFVNTTSATLSQSAGFPAEAPKDANLSDRRKPRHPPCRRKAFHCCSLATFERRSIHPRTSSTSPFFPVALRHQIPVRRSSPKILRHGWTTDEPQAELEECFVTVQWPHAGLPPLAPGEMLRSPKSRLGPPAKLQSPRLVWPARNPLAREEEFILVPCASIERRMEVVF